MILLCLQKYFGVNLLLETPPHMKNVGVEMLPVLYMAKKLSPIIAKTKKIPGYPDEPKIYLYETY